MQVADDEFRVFTRQKAQQYPETCCGLPLSSRYEIPRDLRLAIPDLLAYLRIPLGTFVQGAFPYQDSTRGLVGKYSGSTIGLCLEAGSCQAPFGITMTGGLKPESKLLKGVILTFVSGLRIPWVTLGLTEPHIQVNNGDSQETKCLAQGVDNGVLDLSWTVPFHRRFEGEFPPT